MSDRETPRIEGHRLSRWFWTWIATVPGTAQTKPQIIGGSAMTRRGALRRAERAVGRIVAWESGIGWQLRPDPPIRCGAWEARA